jgi:hypothetical protein
MVLPAASELPWIGLSDSLEILVLMAEGGDRRFDRAAARLDRPPPDGDAPDDPQRREVARRDGRAPTAVRGVAASIRASALASLAPRCHVAV